MAPGSRVASFGGASSWMSSERSARIIAPNESAFSRKQSSIPPPAISRPASAGPVMRDVWIRTLWSPTALTTRSDPTISITKLWRAGMSTASTNPRARTSAITIHAAMSPVAERANRVSAGHRHQRLGHEQQLALGHRVGDEAAPGSGEQHRQELERGGQADGEGAAREGQHQPHLGDDLHPVAADRDQLAGEPAPVVRDLKRADRASEGGCSTGTALRAHPPSSIRSRTSAARSSASTSSESSSRSRRERYAFLRLRSLRQ